MQLLNKIVEIEGSLSEAQVPLEALFLEAGINRSTWTRWRAGKTSPRLNTWTAAEEASQRVLDKSVRPNLDKHAP
jgi:hypothetical protein